MSSLDTIGVRVEADEPEPVIGNARAILHEVATLLERLADSGEPGVIDLRAMPLAPGDPEHLRSVLGDGELRAELDTLGRSEVRETAIHGVWWVTHGNAAGETVAEFIEVTHIPEILRTDPADVKLGVTRLRDRLAGDEDNHAGEGDHG
jgi:hydrogenase-1 operon protein HyaF